MVGGISGARDPATGWLLAYRAVAAEKQNAIQESIEPAQVRRRLLESDAARRYSYPDRETCHLLDTGPELDSGEVLGLCGALGDFGCRRKS